MTLFTEMIDVYDILKVVGCKMFLEIKSNE